MDLGEIYTVDVIGGRKDTLQETEETELHHVHN